MKDNKIQDVVKSVLREFVNEQIEEKFYIWTDKTGRGEIQNKLTKSHIEKTWNLKEIDNNGVTLGEYLNDSYIGDKWETRTERLECIEIH